MQGLYGIIMNELKKQRKLPDKYAYPDGPKIATSGCVLYADAINNNGGSHSNSATRWTPIIGSTKGIKVGSPTWTVNGLNTSNGGFYFQKTTGMKAITAEAVFTPLKNPNSDWSDNTFHQITSSSITSDPSIFLPTNLHL